MKTKLLVLVALLLIASVVPLAGAAAQEMTETIHCDSTLATLLLVAEHDYDYLSNMMMDEMMMDNPAAKVDLGALTPLAESIMMMQESMDEDMSMGDMTEEQMMAHDEMLASMMAMSPADQVAAYMASMNMETMDMMMPLPTGDVAGEDPQCAVVRADVETFLVAHILTELSMMGDM